MRNIATMKKLFSKIKLMNYFLIFTSVFVGVFYTHGLISYLGISPVLASSSAGVFSYFFLKKINKKPISGDYLIAVYCGSFVGMGSTLSTVELALAAVVCTVVLLLFSKSFLGFGGRLGFVAYISSFLAELVIFTFGVRDLHFLDFEVNFYFDILDYLTIISSSILGFYLTVHLNHRLKYIPVFASSFPAFILSCLCIFNSSSFILLFISAFYSASFLGMLAENIIPKRHFPILIFIHSIIYLFFAKNIGNYGGSLGTIAFISVLMVELNWLLNRFSKKV